MEGGWGVPPSGRPILRSIKQVHLASPDSRNRFFEMAPESHSLGKTSTSSANKSFGVTHVMVSALGSFQTLQTQWFERHARPAVFARRKPHFERYRLFRHDEYTVFCLAVSFRSINTVHSALENAQSLIFAVLLVLCLLRRL